MTSEQKHERDLEQAAKALTVRRAKKQTSELAAKHAKKLEQPDDKLAERVQQLSTETAQHKAELREQRIEVQAQLETEAAREAKAEVKLLAELQRTFPHDKIERPGHGKAGGDILHEVFDESSREKAGLIVCECKDTKTWQSGFLTRREKRA